MSLRQSREKRSRSNEAEIEKLAKQQGVKPFDFDEAVGEGSQLWKNGDFEEFEKWLRNVRVSDTADEKLK